ncbi:SDR family oxidoreductase [Fluviicola sp.]|uniref:SDR family oxidoreductase n=1 Tax=Fluviicola sp. TaxID=1917219 RepID=UPI0031E36588
MKDKIVLITGATGGIGKAAAMELAKKQFTVIIHGRNKAKTQQVCEEIRMITGNSKVDYLVADLFLIAETKQLIREFKEKYERLDVLINNAGGLMSNERENTAEGIEKTIAVNLFAPFLLMNGLSNLLKASPEARIINVSSNSHKLNAKPDFTDLQLVNGYNPLRSYGNSKLFLIWISQYLAKELKEQGIGHVTVNTLHPGAVATGFGTNSNLGPFMNTLAKWMRPFFRTPEKGADTIVYLATSEEAQKVSGKYFVNRKQARVTEKYYTTANEKLVWDYCEKEVSKVE